MALGYLILLNENYHSPFLKFDIIAIKPKSRPLNQHVSDIGYNLNNKYFATTFNGIVNLLYQYILVV